MTSERKVWLENVRNHQIGGETDGIPLEVAEDIGFRPPSLGSTALNNISHDKKTPKKPFKGTRKNSKSRNDKIYERIYRNGNPWGSDIRDY